MSKELKYRVVLSGSVLSEHSRAEVIDELVELFNSKHETMGKLLQGKPTPLTKIYSKVEAEKVCQTICQTGAECFIEKIARSSSSTDKQDDATDSTEQLHSQFSKKERSVMDYVAVNSDYYAKQFAKFGDIDNPRFAISWHWPAFFVFFFWAIYRKLWQWAGVYFVGNALLLLMVDWIIAYIMWLLLWPLVANYLYFLHVRKRVVVGSGKPNQSGGTNRRGVLVTLMAMFMLSWVLSAPITEHLLQRSLLQLGSELEKIGPLQRGDGSRIDDLTGIDTQSGVTVARLGLSALKLKWLLLNNGGNDRVNGSMTQSQIIENFAHDFARTQTQDAWGRLIEMRQNADSVVIISAGVDGVFDNADDLLQYISLPNRL